MKRIAVILTVSLVSLFGCSEINGDLKFMHDLKNSISEAYKTKDIEVTIVNKTALKVLLKDSKFDDYSSDKKVSISRDIGKLANSLRENKEFFTMGVVEFIDEENYPLVKKSSSESYNMY
ncbi:hypothetical protein [Telluribacter humicola]|uniref:hypothetical protein n=1 Tax=Telluribacter humicola TaxID=1720261 RepID=UPI001A95DD21|nr:hypothetical protein [Telluribacter humicola]